MLGLPKVPRSPTPACISVMEGWSFYHYQQVNFQICDSVPNPVLTTHEGGKMSSLICLCTSNLIPIFSSHGLLFVVKHQMIPTRKGFMYYHVKTHPLP